METSKRIKLFIPSYFNSHTYILDSKKLLIVGVSSYDFETKVQIRLLSGDSFFELTTQMFINFYNQKNCIQAAFEEMSNISMEPDNDEALSKKKKKKSAINSKRIYPLGQNSLIKLVAIEEKKKRENNDNIKIVIENYFLSRKIILSVKEFTDFMEIADLLFYLVSISAACEQSIKDYYKEFVLLCQEKNTFKINPSLFTVREKNETFNLKKLVLEFYFIAKWRASNDVAIAFDVCEEKNHSVQ